MRTYYESDIRKRTLVLSFVLAVWAAVVALRLVQIQILGHARAKAAVVDQNRDKITIEPLRGRILDRYGEILACSLPAVSVNIRPVINETPAGERNKVRDLQRLLGLSEKDVSYILGRLKDKSNFTYVKKKISEEDAARVMALKLPGIEFEPATRRHYPLGSRASHVLGGLNLTEDSKAGVEARYDDILKGEEGTRRLMGLIEAFIDGGGNMATFTVTDAEELKRAMKEPENYRHLRVRMGGWSAYFVTLGEEQQRLHIQRVEHGLA